MEFSNTKGFEKIKLEYHKGEKKLKELAVLNKSSQRVLQ
jgi:hypothetical protein